MVLLSATNTAPQKIICITETCCICMTWNKNSEGGIQKRCFLRKSIVKKRLHMKKYSTKWNKLSFFFCWKMTPTLDMREYVVLWHREEYQVRIKICSIFFLQKKWMLNHTTHSRESELLKPTMHYARGKVAKEKITRRKKNTEIT